MPTPDPNDRRAALEAHRHAADALAEALLLWLVGLPALVGIIAAAVYLFAKGS